MSRKMKDSRVEWIGEIPTDWAPEKVKFHFDNYKNIAGESHVNYERLALTLNGVIKRSKEASDGLQPENFSSYQILKENSLVFKLIDLANVHTSRVGLSPYTGIVSPAYICLESTDKTNMKFAEYWFLTMWFTEIFNHIGNEGIRNSLGADDLKNVTMPYPSLTEQSQIVHFLDSKCSAIDIAIEKTKKSIEKLEEYKKAVITKAVTKGIDPNAKMKDSGVEWIGEIPEGWEVKPLRQFYSRRLNKNKDMSENNLLSLSYGKIIRKNIETKEGLLPESFDGYNIVEPGDIVIRGTDLQNDHRSLRTGLVTERGIITSAYMTLKPNVHVNSEYYHYLLHCYDLAKVFYSMGGGLRQGLDYWEFIRLFVLVPSQKKQCEIVNYIKDKCSAIDTAMEKKKKAIEEWEEYKKSLIYYAVTGKIDCRNEA